MMFNEPIELEMPKGILSITFIECKEPNLRNQRSLRSVAPPLQFDVKINFYTEVCTYSGILKFYDLVKEFYELTTDMIADMLSKKPYSMCIYPNYIDIHYQYPSAYVGQIRVYTMTQQKDAVISGVPREEEIAQESIKFDPTDHLNINAHKRDKVQETIAVGILIKQLTKLKKKFIELQNSYDILRAKQADSEIRISALEAEINRKKTDVGIFEAGNITSSNDDLPS